MPGVPEVEPIESWIESETGKTRAERRRQARTESKDPQLVESHRERNRELRRDRLRRDPNAYRLRRRTFGAWRRRVV